RQDSEGKTVCNICYIYYKRHDSAQPIDMKSDVIRKRSRHDVHAVVQARRESLSGAASGNGYAYGGIPTPFLFLWIFTEKPYQTSRLIPLVTGPTTFKAMYYLSLQVLEPLDRNHHLQSENHLQ
ncbi:hypothetical protein GGU11DRAFT_690738, partial [Lentinula aff. detonsa]